MKRILDLKDKKSDSKKSNTQEKAPDFAAHIPASKTDKDTINDQTELWITMIDVGQGESTLIRYRKKIGAEKWKDFHVVLIDGGRAHFAEGTIIPTLVQLGVEKIDTIVCSHYDADHMEGLTRVIATYKPKNLYERGLNVRANDDKVKKFREAFSEERMTFTPNERRRLGDGETALEIECVAVNSEGTDWSDENDYSIALLVRFGGFSFYLGGDLTSKIEDTLDLGGHVCAFKCGHHGSKHSTSPDFLKYIKPNAAFISAANHSYCHPDDETIERLYKSEAVKKIYLTNCVYNRAGINSDFENSELALKEKIYSKVKNWLKSGANSDLIESPPEGFDDILKLEFEDDEEMKDEGEEKIAKKDKEEVIETGKEKAKEKRTFENLLKKDKLEIKSGQVRKILSGDENQEKRKKWYYLADLYYSAYDLHHQLDTRKTRTIPIKGVVAATGNHLGNIHLIVSGEDAVAKNQQFKVYFSDGTKMKMIAHKCGTDCSVAVDADRADVKIVDRKAGYKFIPSFSKITGPSGEERKNLTPDEVMDLGDQIDTLMHFVIAHDEDEEFIKGVNDKLNGILTAKPEPNLLEFIADYDKLVALREELSKTYGNEHNLMVPAAQVKKVLPQMVPPTMETSSSSGSTKKRTRKNKDEEDYDHEKQDDYDEGDEYDEYDEYNDQ